MHIFAYSKREGTVAAKYKLLDGEIVKRRTKLAEEIARKNKEEYYKSFIGKEVDVLIEKDGGYTKEYVKILCSGSEGSIQKVIPKLYDAKQEVLI